MRIPIYQIDAFADRLFAGNPAAVCPLESWPDDDLLQRIAAENNLSETAFFVRKGDVFELCWFTPSIEVDLCGHATLAAACVIFTELDPGRASITFRTRHVGPLHITRDGEWIVMDLPAQRPAPRDAPEALKRGLGNGIGEVLLADNYMVVYGSEEEVLALRPDFAALGRIKDVGIIVTAPASSDRSGVDFVSRFFAPAVGIDEDPVTGSAHCMLAPYWAERLGKSRLLAHQVSTRGGAIRCDYNGGKRVVIAGRAVKYLEGTIEVPAIWQHTESA